MEHKRPRGECAGNLRNLGLGTARRRTGNGTKSASRGIGNRTKIAQRGSGHGPESVPSIASWSRKITWGGGGGGYHTLSGGERHTSLWLLVKNRSRMTRLWLGGWCLVTKSEKFREHGAQNTMN